MSTLANLLGDCPLFDELAAHELQAVARFFTLVEAVPEEVLFNEGDPGNYLFVILSGKVAVRKANADGSTVQLATLGAGRTVGEMAVIDRECRSATCVAIGETTLAALSSEALGRMVDARPQLAFHLMQRMAIMLSRRLRQVEGQLVDFL